MGLDAEKMRKLAMTRIMKDYYNSLAKNLGAVLKRLESEVYEDFVDAGISETKISFFITDKNNNKKIIFQDRKNRKLTISSEPRITVVSETELHTWLREHSAGNLIKESVHPKSLKTFIKSLRQENKPLPKETTLKVWDQPKIKVTKV